MFPLLPSKLCTIVHFYRPDCHPKRYSSVIFSVFDFNDFNAIFCVCSTLCQSFPRLSFPSLSRSILSFVSTLVLFESCVCYSPPSCPLSMSAILLFFSCSHSLPYATFPSPHILYAFSSHRPSSEWLRTFDNMYLEKDVIFIMSWAWDKGKKSWLPDGNRTDPLSYGESHGEQGHYLGSYVTNVLYTAAITNVDGVLYGDNW